MNTKKKQKKIIILKVLVILSDTYIERTLVKNMGFKNYWKPTPKNLRRLGDSLLGVSMFITTYSIMEDMTGLAIGSMIVGVVGKFLTNFFKEDSSETE